MKFLDHDMADPFEPYHAVFIDKTRLQWLLAGSLAINALLILVLFAAVLRPAQVIVKDRISGAAPQVIDATVEPAVTATDARVFFINILKMRFGWSSSSLERDMHNYLGQCLKEQRLRDLSYLQQPIQAQTAPGAASVSRLQAWRSAGLSNTLVWPENLDDVVCSPQKEGIWRCEVTAQIVTEQSLSEARSQAPVRATFLATLYPVRHTVHTPSGLVVGNLQHVVLGNGGML